MSVSRLNEVAAARRRAGSARDDGKRRGQSLVELAISLPLLLLLMLGTIDLGRMFFDYIQLRNAAREGAAYGARAPADAAGIEQRVRNHGIPAGITVSSACTPAPCTYKLDATETITVTAARTFVPITSGFLARFGLN